MYAVWATAATVGGLNREIARYIHPYNYCHPTKPLAAGPGLKPVRNSSRTRRAAERLRTRLTRATLPSILRRLQKALRPFLLNRTGSLSRSGYSFPQECAGCIELEQPMDEAQNRRFLKALVNRLLIKTIYRRGSSRWLKAVEAKYGGLVQNIPYNKASPIGPAYGSSTERSNRKYGLKGGDRMSSHGYAKAYSRHLPIEHNTDGRGMVIVEIGVLLGTGLAIWSELFPKARLIGLDIDLSRVKNNLSCLRKRGAFAFRAPELYEFDQFADNTILIDNILRNDKVDICMDDGYHSDDSILSSFRDFAPHMAQDFVYFVEDNAQVHEKIRQAYPQFDIEWSGQLTIIKNDSKNPSAQR